MQKAKKETWYIIVDAEDEGKDQETLRSTASGALSVPSCMLAQSLRHRLANAIKPSACFDSNLRTIAMSTGGAQRGRSRGGGPGSSKKRGNPARDSPDVQMSKTLSYLLRHGAEKEKLAIRDDGFVRVRDLVRTLHVD
jgi:hypothetical protein